MRALSDTPTDTDADMVTTTYTDTDTTSDAIADAVADTDACRKLLGCFAGIILDIFPKCWHHLQVSTIPLIQRLPPLPPTLLF